MSEIDPGSVRLGKQDYKADPRTPLMTRFLDTTQLTAPNIFDLDKGRKPFPTNVWGNDEWGDCVDAAQVNQLVRLERIEQRRTIAITDGDVVSRYKLQTGARSPGDANDAGLVMLDTLSQWRHTGWTFAASGHIFTIAAYGELEPNDPKQLNLGTYLLHGVQLGFSLPLAAQIMTRSGRWEYHGDVGPEWVAGSWGGHAVYTKAYTPQGRWVRTWGMDVFVTNEFVTRYCDEAWVVVDDLDRWRKTPGFDVAALEAYLSEIGAKHVG